MMDLSSILNYLALSSALFTVGLCGIFINRKNIIGILMSIELMLLAVNINFVAFSTYLNQISGQIFTIYVITVAAAEAAIGLAILVVYYREANDIDISNVNQLRG